MTTHQILALLGDEVLETRKDLVKEFFLQSLELVQGQLPPDLRQAVDVARRYSVRQASDEELVAARVSCWQHIKALAPGSANQREECAARAIVFSLFPQVDEPVDAAEFFVSFLGRFASVEREQAKILTRLFAAELPSSH